MPKAFTNSVSQPILEPPLFYLALAVFNITSLLVSAYKFICIVVPIRSRTQYK